MVASPGRIRRPPEASWKHVAISAGAQSNRLYLAGCYWSISTMFSGASYMPPKSSAELAFANAFLLFSVLFGSVLVSSLAAMMMEFQISHREHRCKVRTLQRFLSQNQVSMQLAANIQEQVVERMSVSKQIRTEDVEVLSLISTRLRADLRSSLFAPLVLSNPFLFCCNSGKTVSSQRRPFVNSSGQRRVPRVPWHSARSRPSARPMPISSRRPPQNLQAALNKYGGTIFKFGRHHINLKPRNHLFCLNGIRQF